VAAPGGTGPIGPYPPGVEDDDARAEYDRMRRRLLWKLPTGLYVLGVRVGDRRNGMTISWVTQLSFDPKLVGVSVERTAYTHELLDEGGVFVLNLLDREERAVVRRFTKPVELDAEARTMNGFGYRDGLSGAPVLDMAAAWVDCEVRERLALGGHTLFVGEVVDCGFARDEDTPVLRMEDTRMSYGG
jgi:flavin reductase (DIM6/NTAB) family NADH-FMN oxidoreductase RutF